MPFIGGYLIDTHGILTVMRWSYIDLAIVGVIAGVVRLSMLTETFSPQRRKAGERYRLKEMGKIVKDAFTEHLQTWLWMPPSALARALDKFGRRRILLATTASDVFTYILFIRCGMFVQVLALWIIGSFIWSFYDPTYSSLEADLVPEEKRGRVFAAFGVAWSAFTVPASLVGGFLYERVSPELSFVIASMGVAVCFIITALFIRQPETNED